MSNQQQPRFDIVDKFCCGKNWRFYDDLKAKEIGFAFKPSEEEVTAWSSFGFTKLKHLLKFLKKEYGSLDKFELTFFKGNYPQAYYVSNENEQFTVLINIDSYIEYGREIDAAVKELKVQEYARRIWADYSDKVPKNFFKGEPPTALVEELQNSYYTVLEKLINEFEKMSVPEKQKIKDAIEHSKLGTAIIKKYQKLDPDAPEIELKKFLEVVEKLGEQEVGELLNSILKSKVSRYFVKQLAKLSTKEQNKIFKKLPEMSRMLDRYEKLEKSLKEFKKKVKEHQNASEKNEHELHELLVKDYWLLGIEYFDKRILSDITPDGQLTGDTKIGSRKHADFIIERIDGLDKCVIIELEEANDPIFRKDGTLSKGVYDGIHQAVDYYIEQRSQGYNSRGIAVIGSTLGTKLTEGQKKKMRLLKEAFHNVEVLTYDEIIDKAENTLRFWKSYMPSD
jgi:hypothetical protein